MPRNTTKKLSPAKAGTKRRLDFDEDGDSAVAAVQRPSKLAATTTSVSRKEKQTTISSAFSSPVAKKLDKRSKVVTPEEEKKQDDDETTTTKRSGFVPKYIHKNLSYYCQGDSELDPITRKAFEKVMESHMIPQDLEQSREYGPKSGSSLEDRVLRAYALGQLTPREDYQGDARICTACAETGHKRDACPTLI